MSRAIRLLGLALVVASLGVVLLAEPTAEAQSRKPARARAATLRRKLLPATVARRASASAKAKALTPAKAALLLSPPHVELKLSPSYYDEHADRVCHDLMFFAPDMTGVDPIIDNGLASSAPPPRRMLFAPLPRTEDSVALARDLDRLMLFRDEPTRQFDGVATGVSMFAASALASAHAPRRLRLFFDKPVHLGPAIFQGGGMGAGVGGNVP